MKKQIVKHFGRSRWRMTFVLATVAFTLFSAQGSALGGRSLSGSPAGQNATYYGLDQGTGFANRGLDLGAMYGGEAAAGPIETYARPLTDYGLNAGQSAAGPVSGMNVRQNIGQSGASYGLDQGTGFANRGLDLGAMYGGEAAAGPIENIARPWTNFGLNIGRFYSGGWF